MNDASGPNTGDLALRGDRISSKELLDLHAAANGHDSKSSDWGPGTRTDPLPAAYLDPEPRHQKHQKPRLRLGVEIEDGQGFIAITDHHTGARATIALSLESMASMGGLMIMSNNPGEVRFGCWLEGELTVAK